MALPKQFLDVNLLFNRINRNGSYSQYDGNHGMVSSLKQEHKKDILTGRYPGVSTILIDLPFKVDKKWYDKEGLGFFMHPRR